MTRLKYGGTQTHKTMNGVKTLYHRDTTDPPEEEEVNVNGTVYDYDIDATDETITEYIKREYKGLLDAFPTLIVTLLDKGDHVEPFFDFCIEDTDGDAQVNEQAIRWWLEHRED